MTRYFDEVIGFRQFVHEAWLDHTNSIFVLRIAQEIEENMIIFDHEVCIKEFGREVD